ncbi:MAG TPA: hypothetical protein VLI90_13545, partial [Tepidisphaeraceae bacterium]|nr:hypothetical protein [Tepidisphaeraceae bacterium]
MNQTRSWRRVLTFLDREVETGNKNVALLIAGLPRGRPSIIGADPSARAIGTRMLGSSSNKHFCPPSCLSGSSKLRSPGREKEDAMKMFAALFIGLIAADVSGTWTLHYDQD